MKLNKKPVIAYLFTHWDPEWYRTVSAFNIRLVEIVDNVLDMLVSGKIPNFYADGQVLILENYLKFRPDKEKLIKKLVKEKKLNIGPFYTSPDNFLVSGASLIKNLEFGIDFSKKFSEDRFIGYLSDTFGHSKGIFEIFKYFGIENVIIWRGSPDICADFTANGLKTTRLVYGYYQDMLQFEGSVDKKTEMMKRTLDKINEKSGDIVLLPLGGDHLNISKESSFIIEEMNKKLDYEIKISTIFEYFKKADYSKKKIEGEFLDNSNTYILSGVYSARTDEKKNNASLQFDLFYKTALFNKFSGEKYGSELNYAAKKLILNHAHDSIYGCSVDEVHTMVRARQLEVRETIDTVNKYLIRDFKKENLVKEKKEVGIFNFSNYPQKGVVRLVTDKKIKNAQKIRAFNSVSDDIFYDSFKNPMTEDFHTFYEYLIEVDEIKPFTFKNGEIKELEKRHEIGADFIENEFIKIFVLENKIYAIDKKTNKLYEDFISLNSTKDGGDSYNYAPLSLPSILKLKKTKAVLKGKIKSTLQVLFEENIKLNFSLTNNLDYVEIEIDFINKKKDRKLQIVFNTGASIEKTTAEDSIGLISREHNPTYLLYDNIPVKNKEELKSGAYPMQRFVSANNITVFTQGLNEYETYKNDLKITVLRSTGVISNPKNPARGVPAGPPIDCPDMQGLSQHNFKLAFAFDCKKPFLTADNFYYPFEAVLGEFKLKEKTFMKNSKGIFYGLNMKNKPIFYKDGKWI